MVLLSYMVCIHIPLKLVSKSLGVIALNSKEDLMVAGFLFTSFHHHIYFYFYFISRLAYILLYFILCPLLCVCYFFFINYFLSCSAFPIVIEALILIWKNWRNKNPLLG